MASGAKPAVQDRSKGTRDRLLAAMDALLREKPFEALSVGEIAARAGVSPATIYQRFSNKDAAAAILIELYMRAAEAWSRSEEGRFDVAAAATLHEAFVALGLTAWRQVEALGHVMRPAYLLSRRRPDLLGERWTALQGQARAGFARLLAAFPEALGGRDPEAAAGMIAYFYNMMLLGRLLHADELAAAGRASDAQAFAVELADFACGYLTAAAQPDTGGAAR